mmetsp:Transcript_129645/g.252459  ORF Transcript_129645/g.252459 Transcript_129645/m.252459 type:complete len:239 (+) Transcript_129645:37-753(+)
MGGHASSLVDATHGTEWLHGHGTWPTSAVSSSFTDVSLSQAKKMIHNANVGDQRLWEQVKLHKDALPAKRATLESALDQRMKDMRPLCHAYMMQRAELAGIGAAQCAAAQGRLNASEVGYDSGPSGCLNESQAALIRGTPGSLPQARCTHSSHQLLCSERLRELLDGAPSPASSTAATEQHKSPLSMDEEVRAWCHPAYSLPAKKLSPELARGALPAAGGSEDEMDEEHNLDDSAHVA